MGRGPAALRIPRAVRDVLSSPFSRFPQRFSRPSWGGARRTLRQEQEIYFRERIVTTGLPPIGKFHERSASRFPLFRPATRTRAATASRKPFTSKEFPVLMAKRGPAGRVETGKLSTPHRLGPERRDSSSRPHRTRVTAGDATNYPSRSATPVCCVTHPLRREAG